MLSNVTEIAPRASFGHLPFGFFTVATDKLLADFR